MGHNVGPGIAAVIHHVFQHGWKAPRITQSSSSPKNLPCIHLTCEWIFYKVLKDSRRYYDIWHMSEGPKLYNTSPPQCIVDDMITGPTKFLRFKQIALRLDTHRYRFGKHLYTSLYVLLLQPMEQISHFRMALQLMKSQKRHLNI